MAGTRPFSWTLANSILVICLSAFVSKLLLQAVVGWYLRRRTTSRKITILARVKLEEAQYQLSASQSHKSDDGEWEKVEKHTAGSAKNGGEADDEWEGIIGFFHPFWSVQPLGIRSSIN